MLEAAQEDGKGCGRVEGTAAASHDGGRRSRLSTGGREDGREGAGEMHAMTLHVEEYRSGRCGYIGRGWGRRT